MTNQAIRNAAERIYSYVHADSETDTHKSEVHSIASILEESFRIQDADIPELVEAAQRLLTARETNRPMDELHCTNEILDIAERIRGQSK